MSEEISYSSPPALSVAWRGSTPIQVSLPGGIAVRGERGPRGTKFLGSYPTRAALPSLAVLSDALAVGDFAFLQDEGVVVQISP